VVHRSRPRYRGRGRIPPAVRVPPRSGSVIWAGANDAAGLSIPLSELGRISRLTQCDQPPLAFVLKRTEFDRREVACRRIPHSDNHGAERDLVGRARVYIGGSGSNDKDIKEYAASDLLIVAIAAFVLIF
jgi:hypothetical protein